jgi:hypothetical protein
MYAKKLKKLISGYLVFPKIISFLYCAILASSAFPSAGILITIVMFAN